MGVVDPPNVAGAVLPEQWGKYSLVGHLATGGMAEVWLARQFGLQGFEKVVVIKRARPELTDEETTRQFLDEARLVATLQHPNIAQVYEIGSVGSSYFFVMEYVDGADLRRLIEASIARRKRVPLADALYIITHVCAALHYAHEKRDLDGTPLGIIHRDVSPSNVLISHDGAIKVCDFGVAKAHSRRTEDTQRGVLKGKFSYMSPEQCQSRPLDRRSDVFSIGILLYELTTLCKLFRGKSDYALLQTVVEAKVPPPSSRMPDYPRELEAIVMKALAKDPGERYQTAQALQLDLEEFAREHKLAMSSVRIASLVGKLFEKRNDELLRAARSQSGPLLTVTDLPTGVGDARAFLADGSAAAAAAAGTGLSPVPAIGTQVAAPAPSTASSQVAPVPRRRVSLLWLVAAVLVAMAAGAITVADRMLAGTADRATASALAADAERIASLLDATARSAHMRADGIAATPMLRAAIETDAATVDDIARTEMVFTNDQGESIEVFQLRGETATSLLRLPRTSAALPVLKGRETRIQSDGRGMTMVVSAPISGYNAGAGGLIVIATPVDLTSIRRGLDDRAVRASLTGLGGELVLVEPRDGAGGEPVELAVPAIGSWSTGAATLTATPKKAIGLPWAWEASTASGGMAVLLLLGFVGSLVRRPRS